MCWRERPLGWGSGEPGPEPPCQVALCELLILSWLPSVEQDQDSQPRKGRWQGQGLGWGNRTCGGQSGGCGHGTKRPAFSFMGAPNQPSFPSPAFCPHHLLPFPFKGRVALAQTRLVFLNQSPVSAGRKHHGEQHKLIFGFGMELELLLQVHHGLA